MSGKKEEKEEAPAEAEGAEGEGTPKKGKKKLIFIIAGVVLLLAIVGGLFASGVFGGGEKKEETAKELTPEEEAKAKEAAKPVYYELPQFLVNLTSANTNRVSFLKMSVTLELKDQASVAVVDANKPRIVDTFNTYLRELHASDVQGSAGIYRLRDELLARLNATIDGEPVKDILFTEIIVQ